MDVPDIWGEGGGHGWILDTVYSGEGGNISNSGRFGEDKHLVFSNTDKEACKASHCYVLFQIRISEKEINLSKYSPMEVKSRENL